ncbi:fimbrial protein [Paraburkholderia fungorum]|uniref:hypothetical protein n=1 Tax=Paraburkholderia fungorum TaxID=134537 RepID=UPI0038B86F17
MQSLSGEYLLLLLIRDFDMHFNRIMLATASAVLLSTGSSANAATECLFDQSYAVDLKYTVSNIVFDGVQAPTDGYKQLGSAYEMSPTSGVSSTCNSGQDGQALKSRADPVGNPLTQYTVINDKQVLLFNTSTKGIYYAVNMYNKECTDNQGYIPPDKSNVWLADVGDDREKSCMKPGTFGFKILFFVGKDYKPSASATFNSAVPATHGYFLLSGAEDDVEKNETHVKLVQFTGQLNN